MTETSRNASHVAGGRVAQAIDDLAEAIETTAMPTPVKRSLQARVDELRQPGADVRAVFESLMESVEDHAAVIPRVFESVHALGAALRPS